MTILCNACAMAVRSLPSRRQLAKAFRSAIMTRVCLCAWRDADVISRELPPHIVRTWRVHLGSQASSCSSQADFTIDCYTLAVDMRSRTCACRRRADRHNMSRSTALTTFAHFSPRSGRPATYPRNMHAPRVFKFLQKI